MNGEGSRGEGRRLIWKGKSNTNPLPQLTGHAIRVAVLIMVEILSGI